MIAELPEAITQKLRQMQKWRQRLLFSSPVLHQSSRELFRDAVGMSEAGLTFDEQCAVLRLRFDGYYRRIEDREIENAVRSAMGLGGSGTAARRAYPSVNPELRRTAIVDSLFTTVDDLKKASRVQNPGELRSGAVLDLFFNADDLVCMASTKQAAQTDRRCEFLGLERGLPFIVPNAMSAQWALNSQNRPSVRCNSNVGPIRRVIVEFDAGSLDEQAALIGHLMKHGCAVDMVLFSGGKSLHAWVNVESLSEADRDKLFRYAAALGADRSMFVPCQLCRTPNAIRKENGAKQEVLMLNLQGADSGKAQ